MHTRDDLTNADFTLTIAGRPASFAELFPGLTLESRVAIVADTPAGAFGAAATLLGLVTHWYGERARVGEAFFEYPDYFYLHVGGGGRADLGQLEIWPPHKQLAVDSRTQEVLEAIADRAIDHLLIEDGAPGCARVLRETRNALPRHLRGALAYDASGVAAGADIAVQSSAAAERHVADAIESSTELSPADRDSTRRLRGVLARDGRATERLRRVSLEQAVGLLCRGADGPSPAGGLNEGTLQARSVTIGQGAEAVFAS
jgi:hypothetical protein